VRALLLAARWRRPRRADFIASSRLARRADVLWQRMLLQNETAVVWNFGNANREFLISQSRDMLNHMWSRHAWAPGPGPPLPRLLRDWAHRCHICTGTGLTLPHLHLNNACKSAPGLGAPLPRLRTGWAHPSPICTGTWARPFPHLRRDWTHP
jgi:hypothetical protein